MCPACTEKRVHATEDWKQHPYAGHGYVSGQGWTHPDLARVTTVENRKAIADLLRDINEADPPPAPEKANRLEGNHEV